MSAAATERAASPARVLAQMLVGNQLQQAIYVAAKLGIADLLRDGPRPSAELAEAAGAHPAALYRLLRALAGFGIFAEDEEGRFALTPLAEPLQSGPRSVRSFALWSGGVSYQAYGGLEHSVRTGEPAFEHLFGQEFFEYLATHPESGAVFDEMMSRHTAPVAPAVAAYDFTGVETVVDVGGGRGELLAAILGEHPAMSGVLVDRPGVVEHARVGDRCTTVAGDIFGPLPHGDAFILKSVVHGLSDEAAVRLLANCRRALNPNGIVLLVELVVPPGNEPSPAKQMDLLMLVGCHGRERTADELGALLAEAGLRLVDVTPTKHAYSIVEAR
jgi:hypothetical protein